MPRRIVLTIALGVYLVFIGLMTLGPQPIDDSNDSALRAVLRWLASSPATVWIDYGLVEFVGNIAMFVPLGILLAMLGGPRFWWAALAVCVLCTVAIELAQLSLPDRVSDVRDLIANTIGGMIGIGVVLVVQRTRARPRTAD